MRGFASRLAAIVFVPLLALSAVGCGDSASVTVAAPAGAVFADGRTPAPVQVIVTMAGKAATGDVVLRTDFGSFSPILDPARPPSDTTKTGKLSVAGELKAELYALTAGTATVHVTFTATSPKGDPATKTASVKFEAPSDPVVVLMGPVAEVPSDGRTPAPLAVTITRDGQLARGEVTLKTTFGAFAVIMDPARPPTETTRTGTLAQGELRAQLYAARPGTAELTLSFVETFPSGARSIRPVVRTATVTFTKPSDPAFTITGPMSDVRADGKTAAALVVTVLRDGQPARGDLVLKTNLGAFTLIADPTRPPADTTKTGQLAQGEFKTQLYSAQSGEAQIVVTFTETYANGARADALERLATVTFGTGMGAGKIASLEFVSARPDYLQTKGSGAAETSTVTFQAYDAQGAAAEANLDVTFSVTTLGGAAVMPTMVKTAVGGKVQTTLSSGITVGSVKVMASTPDGAVTKESSPITIAGAPANHRNFDFGCESRTIGGFAYSGLTMKCTALVADRNSQKLGNVAVTFRAEAGAIDPRVVTSAVTATLGNAVAIYKTQDPRPADVAPASAAQYEGFVPPFLRGNGDQGSEPSRPGPCLVPGATVCNPRDGLVTLIAVTAGEEEWTDTNQNGKWDAGEPFVDLPEPYLDVNDNGRFDADDAVEKDQYNDSNQNGKWDAPNGTWDANTQIWKANKVVWTGAPGLYDFHTTPAGPSTPSIEISHCGFGTDVYVLVSDANLNMPSTRAGNTLSCRCSNGACRVMEGTVNLFTQSAGRHYFPFKLDDGHTCSPNCKNSSTPCPDLKGVFSCTATYAPGDGVTTAFSLPAGVSLNVTSF